jgi:hypothetical protein
VSQDVGQIIAYRPARDPEGLRQVLRGQMGILFMSSRDDGRQTFIRGPPGSWNFWGVCSAPSRLANPEVQCGSTESTRAVMFVKAHTNVERFHAFINGEFDDIALLDLLLLFEWGQRIPPNPHAKRVWVLLLYLEMGEYVSIFQALLFKVIFLSITRVRIKNGHPVTLVPFCESISLENASSRILATSRQSYIPLLCSVSSENWRAGIRQIAPIILFSWIGILRLFLIRTLEERTPRDEFQIWKWEGLCGDSDYGRNPGSNALRSVRSMDQELSRCILKGGEHV